MKTIQYNGKNIGGVIAFSEGRLKRTHTMIDKYWVLGMDIPSGFMLCFPTDWVINDGDEIKVVSDRYYKTLGKTLIKN